MAAGSPGNPVGDARGAKRQARARRAKRLRERRTGRRARSGEAEEARGRTAAAGERRAASEAQARRAGSHFAGARGTGQRRRQRERPVSPARSGSSRLPSPGRQPRSFCRKLPPEALGKGTNIPREGAQRPRQAGGKPLIAATAKPGPTSAPTPR